MSSVLLGVFSLQPEADVECQEGTTSYRHSHVYNSLIDDGDLLRSIRGTSTRLTPATPRTLVAVLFHQSSTASKPDKIFRQPSVQPPPSETWSSLESQIIPSTETG